MSDAPRVQLTRHDSVAVLELTRPDKLNAVDMAMHRELAAALKALERDSEVRAVVISGRGRAFCVGQDLSEFAMQEDLRVDEHVRSTYNRLVLQIRESRLPFVAAVEGMAVGAGASIALACDLRVCGRSATFTQGFGRIGLVPDTGATWLLPRLVGTSRALDLFLSGRDVGADEALQTGMVDRVVDDGTAVDRSVELAGSLASWGENVVASTKKAVYRGVEGSLRDALEREAQLQQAAIAHPGHAEAVAGFLAARAGDR